ncbi:hypothetical protein, partial [Treponema endosymbiont of Eucomonympha sp.]|uniref:hypothetical protein n=1 Tax=Treponema endosymbiont of Eucomonympha sp. TaxID=1580831 RepID=UPI001396A42D
MAFRLSPPVDLLGRQLHETPARAAFGHKKRAGLLPRSFVSCLCADCRSDRSVDNYAETARARRQDRSVAPLVETTSKAFLINT